MASAALQLDQTYIQALADFQDTETRMGELSAHLSDVADALSHEPEFLSASIGNDWPDLARLMSLRDAWVGRRDALLAAWRELTPAEQIANLLPPFGALDRSRAFV